jgi:hypothetical protein
MELKYCRGKDLKLIHLPLTSIAHRNRGTTGNHGLEPAASLLLATDASIHP